MPENWHACKRWLNRTVAEGVLAKDESGLSRAARKWGEAGFTLNSKMQPKKLATRWAPPPLPPPDFKVED